MPAAWRLFTKLFVATFDKLLPIAYPSGERYHMRNSMLFHHKEFHKECPMAHKKVERKKELDRRRHRRAERIKQRIHEAKNKKA